MQIMLSQLTIKEKPLCPPPPPQMSRVKMSLSHQNFSLYKVGNTELKVEQCL